MKNIIIIVSIFCLFQIMPLRAQNFEVGGKIGVNSVRLKTNGYFNDNAGVTMSMTRLQASIGTEYMISSYFALDLSLGYVGKGGRDFEKDDDLRIGIPDFHRKLEYISLYSLLRFYFVRDRAIKPFVQVGPGISYQLSATEMGNTISDENLRSKIDLSSNVGLGIKYGITANLKLELTLGWERGLSKTIRQDNESLFNEAFGIVLGVKHTL